MSSTDMTRERLAGGVECPFHEVGVDDSDPTRRLHSCGGTLSSPLPATETVGWLAVLDCRNCGGSGKDAYLGTCHDCSGTGLRFPALLGPCPGLSGEDQHGRWGYVCVTTGSGYHPVKAHECPCHGIGRVPIVFPDDESYVGWLLTAAEAAGFNVSYAGGFGWRVGVFDTAHWVDSGYQAQLHTALGLAWLAAQEGE